MVLKKVKQLSFKAKMGIALAGIIVLILAFTALNYYLKYFGGNVSDRQDYVYIVTGSNFEDVMKEMRRDDLLKDTVSFRWAADNMGYSTRIKPGKYRLEKGMGNRELINMLKAGNQEPVKLAFQNVRLKENFAGLISEKIEADSGSIISLLNNGQYVKKYGFSTSNVYSMFIPNSYELYWNTPAEKFFVKMYEEYKNFWNDERRAKAEKIGLTPVEVSTLASIVDSEALHDAEMRRIAGLYMNRLDKGIKLEADPTVIFANNDFTIRRVLYRHLRKDSPYNTYIYAGLPPGPISMPSIGAIDAVLNYDTHNYLYMCAKDDFSGYHNFAATLSQHLINARKFQNALNARNIKR